MTGTIRKSIVNVKIYDVNVVEYNDTYTDVHSCNVTDVAQHCTVYTNAEFLLGSLGTLIGWLVYLKSSADGARTSV